MNAEELRQLAEDICCIDPEMLVVLSADSEGNRASELDDWSLGSYSDGQIGICELTPELKAKGYSDEDVRPGGHVLVLWPE